MDFPILVRVMSKSDREREQADIQAEVQRAYQAGRTEVLQVLYQALQPAVDSLCRLVIAYSPQLGDLYFAPAGRSPQALAQELARLLTRLGNLAVDTERVKAEVKLLHAAQTRQRQIERDQAEAAELERLRQQLAETQAKIGSLELQKEFLEQDVDRLQTETERQSAVIVELNERLKPARPATQK